MRVSMERIAFEAIPRAAVLAVLWESIESFMGIASEIASKPLHILSLFQSPSALLSTLSTFLSLATLLTASPLLYSLTLSLLALAKGLTGYIVSPLSILCFCIVLLFDVLRNSYRDRQRESVEISFKSFVKGVAWLVALTAPIALISIAVAYYTTGFVKGFTALETKASVPSLIQCFSNPVIKAVAIAALVAAFYTVLSEFIDILPLFVFPSKKISLSILRRLEDLDTYIKTPLDTLKNSLIALLIAPLIYSAIYNAVLPVATQIIPQLSVLESTPLRALISIAPFIASYKAVSVASHSILWGEPLKALKTSLVLLAFIYLCIALYTFSRGSSIVDAFVRPDIEGFGRGVVDSYIALYTFFIYLFELLTKLVGVAP